MFTIETHQMKPKKETNKGKKVEMPSVEELSGLDLVNLFYSAMIMNLKVKIFQE